jgi:hypothetical protein
MKCKKGKKKKKMKQYGGGGSSGARSHQWHAGTRNLFNQRIDCALMSLQTTRY